MDLLAGDYLIIYVLALVIMLPFDGLWTSWIGGDMYKKHLKKRLAKDVDMAAASLYFLLFVMGMVYFAIAPAVRSESLSTAMAAGALYGFFTYSTYALTNLATLKDWPRVLVPVDIAWGTLLSFFTSVITYAIHNGLIA